MPAPSDLKARATAAIEANRDEILALSRAIHADPEPAFEEHRAAARESARISSRFASMAAVARAFRSDGAGMLTSTLGCDEGGSALDGERELGEDDEHDHEDCDGQAQDSLEAKGHEQPHHEPDPQAAACGAACGSGSWWGCSWP